MPFPPPSRVPVGPRRRTLLAAAAGAALLVGCSAEPDGRRRAGRQPVGRGAGTRACGRDSAALVERYDAVIAAHPGAGGAAGAAAGGGRTARRRRSAARRRRRASAGRRRPRRRLSVRVGLRSAPAPPAREQAPRRAGRRRAGARRDTRRRRCWRPGRAGPAAGLGGGGRGGARLSADRAAKEPRHERRQDAELQGRSRPRWPPSTRRCTGTGSSAAGSARRRRGEARRRTTRTGPGGTRWRATVRDLGGTPVAAAAAYALPFPVPDSGRGRAARRRAGGPGGRACTPTSSGPPRATLRREAAGALREAAVRAVRWRGGERSLPWARRAGRGRPPAAPATPAPTRTRRKRHELGKGTTHAWLSNRRSVWCGRSARRGGPDGADWLGDGCPQLTAEALSATARVDRGAGAGARRPQQPGPAGAAGRRHPGRAEAGARRGPAPEQERAALAHWDGWGAVQLLDRGVRRRTARCCWSGCIPRCRCGRCPRRRRCWRRRGRCGGCGSSRPAGHVLRDGRRSGPGGRPRPMRPARRPTPEAGARWSTRRSRRARSCSAAPPEAAAAARRRSGRARCWRASGRRGWRWGRIRWSASARSTWRGWCGTGWRT